MAVVVAFAAPFLYDDGKKLTGTGTLASKSRLTINQVRENVSFVEKKRSLASF